MTELSTRRVTADGASPHRWLAVLHGIYGAGRNWRSVAAAVVERRPDWGAALVDLREHGESRGFEPPHTLDRTAADLDTVSVPGRVRAVLGHSFGGKVALLRGQREESIRQLWIVDSTPESRPPAGSAWGMLQTLRGLPDTFDDRDSVVDALAAKGFARPVGQWMSANLERDGSRYRWGLDLDAMESLLEDFFRTDLWDLVESPRAGLEIHFLRATESSVLGLDARERIRAAGVRSGRVFLHDVRGGHWLNADNPDAVVTLISERLPRESN